MRPKNDERGEFVGAQPKNKGIVDRIRAEGYMGVMFNKDDFMDAVIWAANIVVSYREFLKDHRERSVIPIKDLPFLKEDLENAHFLMIIYYKMKDNLVLLEEQKLSLYSVAKFQDVLASDIDIMKKWDENMRLAQQKTDSGDLGGYDMSQLHGTEEKYKRYSTMVSNAMKKYKEKLSKLSY
jgi:hypothetical protein